MERSTFMWIHFLKEKEEKIEKFQKILKALDEGMQTLEEQQQELQEYLDRDRRCCTVAYCKHNRGHKEIVHTLEKLQERLKLFDEDKNKLTSKLKIAIEDAESATERLNSLKKISELINKENQTKLEDLSITTDKPKAVNNKLEEKTQDGGIVEARITRSSGKNKNNQKKTHQEEERSVLKRRVSRCGNNKTAKKKMARK